MININKILTSPVSDKVVNLNKNQKTSIICPEIINVSLLKNGEEDSCCNCEVGNISSVVKKPHNRISSIGHIDNSLFSIIKSLVCCQAEANNGTDVKSKIPMEQILQAGLINTLIEILDDYVTSLDLSSDNEDTKNGQ